MGARTCIAPGCGSAFFPNTDWHVYCSPACHERADPLPARRECAHCHKVFAPVSRGHVHCTTACLGADANAKRDPIVTEVMSR